MQPKSLAGVELSEADLAEELSGSAVLLQVVREHAGTSVALGAERARMKELLMHAQHMLAEVVGQCELAITSVAHIARPAGVLVLLDPGERDRRRWGQLLHLLDLIHGVKVVVEVRRVVGVGSDQHLQVLSNTYMYNVLFMEEDTHRCQEYISITP